MGLGLIGYSRLLIIGFGRRRYFQQPGSLAKRDLFDQGGSSSMDPTPATPGPGSRLGTEEGAGKGKGGKGKEKKKANAATLTSAASKKLTNVSTKASEIRVLKNEVAGAKPELSPGLNCMFLVGSWRLLLEIRCPINIIIVQISL